MKVKVKDFGVTQTNCYIVDCDGYELIIDPGQGAYEWIAQEVKNPVAILNTHGHFDHIWDNQKVKDAYNIPLYAPEKDLFFLQGDAAFHTPVPPSTADFVAKGDEDFLIKETNISYLLFAGHSPGCSMIMIDEVIFSGDFVFADSIGRVDFPYCDAGAMKESIKRFIQLELPDKLMYPGHGGKTTVWAEQKNIVKWLDRL